MNAIDQYINEIILELENARIFNNDPFLEKPRLKKILKKRLLVKFFKSIPLTLTEDEFDDIVNYARFLSVEDSCINLAINGKLKMSVNSEGSYMFTRNF